MVYLYNFRYYKKTSSFANSFRNIYGAIVDNSFQATCTEGVTSQHLWRLVQTFIESLKIAQNKFSQDTISAMVSFLETIVWQEQPSSFGYDCFEKWGPCKNNGDFCSSQRRKQMDFSFVQKCLIYMYISFPRNSALGGIKMVRLLTTRFKQHAQKL